MAPSRIPGPECIINRLWPTDDGTSCRQLSPTPLPVGLEGHQPGDHLREVELTGTEDEPWAGSTLGSLGAPAALRIPVPGSGGLALEFFPRGWVPPASKGGSTSTIFIQDLAGKKHLRLDYGWNKNSSQVEWHWNQDGTAKELGVTNHTSVGAAEAALGRTAKYFRYAGRVFVIYAAGADLYSIVTSSRPLRRSIQVASGWGFGSLGCTAYGGSFALIGTAIEPGIGTVLGGVLGCLVGGFLGYKMGERTAGHVYDWAEDTIFEPIPLETKPPQSAKEYTKPQLPEGPKKGIPPYKL